MMDCNPGTDSIIHETSAPPHFITETIDDGVVRISYKYTAAEQDEIYNDIHEPL
jgi:hypothetical protein